MSSTAPPFACNPCWIAEKLGRYISMDNGPLAVSAPSKTTQPGKALAGLDEAGVMKQGLSENY
ncbi:MAG TPA: hypothetical protein VGC12_05060, partial [Methyloradius sp.]